jgi:hypothetical protein
LRARAARVRVRRLACVGHAVPVLATGCWPWVFGGAARTALPRRIFSAKVSASAVGEARSGQLLLLCCEVREVPTCAVLVMVCSVCPLLSAVADRVCAMPDGVGRRCVMACTGVAPPQVIRVDVLLGVHGNLEPYVVLGVRGRRIYLRTRPTERDPF